MWNSAEGIVLRRVFWVLVLFVVSMNLLLAALGFRAFSIPTRGMVPTLQPGDRIWVNTHAYIHSSPQRGDVVTFVYRDLELGEALLVKRVIAVGGDTIEVILNEPYVAPIDRSTAPPISFGSVTVPAPFSR